MIKNGMRPIHPGEILREEYLEPLGLSANALAHNLGVPANRVSAIIKGTRGVTADTALRLGRAFDTTPEFWMNMQQTYDLRVEETKAPSLLKKILAGIKMLATEVAEPSPPRRDSKQKHEAVAAGERHRERAGHVAGGALVRHAPAKKKGPKKARRPRHPAVVDAAKKTSARSQ